MSRNSLVYYLIIAVFAASAFWLGYAITDLVRDSSPFSTHIMWPSAAAAAMVVGVVVVYVSMIYRHGEQNIPCHIIDTVNVKVNNYHLIMATAKSKRGIASVKSTDHVNGIAVESLNRDAHPHRIKIEVRLNERSDEIASKEMVIDTGAAVSVTLPLPERFRLVDISSVDIRIRQV